MTTITKTGAIQTMIADNDTLIITDPCYLLTDEDWDKFGRKPYNYDNGQEFLSTLNFGECIIADTGFGDWDNYIVADNGLNLGTFCADAGMVCVLTASDFVSYNYDKEKFEKYVSNGLITIIPNYSGTVELYYEDSDEYGKWAVIQGTGEYNWHSIKNS